MINGKRYIGQKKFDIESRWRTYIGSGVHFKNAVNKYGKENFKRDIVDIAYSEEELNVKEFEWINEYNAVNSDDYYNAAEGGDVHKLFRKNNSIPVICIDNNYVFKSIKDASIWSGHTTTTIKKSFKKKHEFNKKENLIFRPLTYVRYNMNLCCVCGINFKKKNNRQKMCKKCSSKKSKSKLIIDHDFDRSKSTGIETFTLNDSWVKKQIIFNNENKITKKFETICENSYKTTKKIKKRKITKYKSRKVKDVEKKEIQIENMKNEIIKLYLIDKKSISEIVKKINIVGLPNDLIKESLLKWGIEIPFQNGIHTNENNINYNAVYDDNGNLVEIFKFKHETRKWINEKNICETKNFSSSQLNQYIRNGKSYKGYLFKLIDENTYNELIKQKTQRSHKV